jgi:predicted nuclease of predicted toxin-antitoxin system
MKILIAQNISFRLINKIEHFFPEIAHVKYCDLIDANDLTLMILIFSSMPKIINLKQF